MIDLDDRRLAEVLASVGELLVTDAAVAAATNDHDAAAVRRRLPTILAAAVAAVAVTVVSVAPLRGAVADWLGLGSTQIVVDSVPPITTAPLPRIDDGLARIDRAAAEQRVGFELASLATTGLGLPEGYAVMPEGGVLVVWRDRSTLWIHDSDMDPGMLLTKLVEAEAEAAVERIDGLGDDALVVTGEHMLHTPRRTVTADATVLWEVGSTELRLESDRSPGELVALARQLAAALA